MITQFDEINGWADQRGLLAIDWDKCKQASFIADELAEFLKANTDNDEIGELCDIIVFAVNAIRLKGYCPNAAMNETIKKINSRTGAFNSESGKWEKDKSVVPYCPDFNLAKVLSF